MVEKKPRGWRGVICCARIRPGNKNLEQLFHNITQLCVWLAEVRSLWVFFLNWEKSQCFWTLSWNEYLSHLRSQMTSNAGAKTNTFLILEAKSAHSQKARDVEQRPGEVESQTPLRTWVNLQNPEISMQWQLFYTFLLRGFSHIFIVFLFPQGAAPGATEPEIPAAPADFGSDEEENFIDVTSDSFLSPNAASQTQQWDGRSSDCQTSLSTPV